MEEDLEVGQMKCNRQKNTRQYCHTFPGAKAHICHTSSYWVYSPIINPHWPSVLQL